MFSGALIRGGQKAIAGSEREASRTDCMPSSGRACRSENGLSRARHVKAGLNPRGPSRKAKYSLATDSEPSSASERWEEPRQGEDSEPETTCLQAIGALWG